MDPHSSLFFPCHRTWAMSALSFASLVCLHLREEPLEGSNQVLLILYLHPLAQCLARRRRSINICWMDECVNGCSLIKVFKLLFQAVEPVLQTEVWRGDLAWGREENGAALVRSSSGASSPACLVLEAPLKNTVYESLIYRVELRRILWFTFWSSGLWFLISSFQVFCVSFSNFYCSQNVLWG